MQNYQQLELPVLIELLAEKTTLYAKMLSIGVVEEEFKACHQTVLELQIEIEHRKKNMGSNTTISDPDIFFEK